MEAYLTAMIGETFLPHGFCILWRDSLLWTYVGADLGIAFSYFVMPLGLAYFARKREDLQYRWLFLLFGAFILACGTSHLVSVLLLWKPWYWLDASLRVVTAVISLTTAVMLIRSIPLALQLPSPQRLRAEIAERERAQQDLEASKLHLKGLNRQLTQLIEALPDAVVLQGQGGQWLIANHPARELFGLAGIAWQGRPTDELIAMNSPRESVYRACTRREQVARQGCHALVDDVEVVLSSGGARCFETRYTPILGETERCQGLVMIARDTTEQRAAERAAQEGTRMLRAFFDVAPIGLALNELDTGRFVEFNTALHRSVGYTREEFAGLSYWELTPDEYRDDELRQIDSLRSTGSYGPYQKEYRRADGTRVPVLLHGVLARDPRGKELIWSIVQDISEQKRVERLMAQAAEDAQLATRAKSEFLANMSHEIRTPMNGVIGLTALALDDCSDPKVCAYLKQIRDSAGNLLSILNDILDFSKIEAGKLDIERVPMDLLEILKPPSLLARLDAEAKQLEFRAEHDASCPRVLGDPVRLAQIANNLLSNAVKFTEQGSVVLSIRRLQSPPEEVRIALEVTDTGIGIDGAARARLFKPFDQADRSITRRYGGSGLGLAITRRLVELMGGDLSFDSLPGRGSTFRVQLAFPLAPPESVTSAPGAGDDEDWRNRYAGKRALVVEDNNVNQIVARALLQKLGFAVDLAGDGRQAVALIDETGDSYAVVFMDIQMPEMDGLEASRLIRQRYDADRLPIIAMTANAFEQDRQAAFEAGMNYHLAKPISVKQLAEALKIVLGGDK